MIMQCDFKRYSTGLLYCLIIVFAFACNQTQSPGTTKIRLITHNVYYGFTKVPERKKNWLEWMRNQNPDIVSLQELNGYTPEQLAEDASSWGHPFSILLKEDGFPTGVTSRFPIEDIQRYQEGFHHGLIRVKIQKIYLYIIHLHPSNWEFRHREIDQILSNMETLPKGSSIILAGDFNTFSPMDGKYYSHGRLEVFFTQLDSLYKGNNLNNGQLDFGVMEKIDNAGLVDLEFTHRPQDYLFTGTFPALIEKEGEHGDLRRLDFIFVNDQFDGEVTKTEVIANDTTQYLSDHLPVLAEFELF
ncbi:MAG: endonuclease/exonuclease/phosphatase family protein [Saprospiraceae bacterium]|nr:endonuclease/exonuclease/phosphatase family protein [Saprospiraceae bacterium]